MQGIRMYMVVVDEACYAKLVVARFSPWFGRNTFPIRINDKKKPQEKRPQKLSHWLKWEEKKKETETFSSEMNGLKQSKTANLIIIFIECDHRKNFVLRMGVKTRENQRFGI